MIADQFDSYLKAATPKGVTFSNAQVQEMRRCFFAGAFVVLTLVKQVGQEDVPEDVGVDKLEEGFAEIYAFYARVKAGLA